MNAGPRGMAQRMPSRHKPLILFDKWHNMLGMLGMKPPEDPGANTRYAIPIKHGRHACPALPAEQKLMN
jgi:hypothetical protein